MPEVTKQFEIRQLLKAYRKGLIPDDLFEEQMRELGAGCDDAPAKRYRLRDQQFATERELVGRFLDEFRAGESFGGEVFAAWASVCTDPRVRGGLNAVCDREAMHGRRLAARLADLGHPARVELPGTFREAACARLGSRDVPDLDKIRDLTRRLPDVEEAVKPIRDVAAQLEDDVETRALLELIAEDELSTLRWFHATEACLAASAGEASGEAKREAPSPDWEQHAHAASNGANGSLRPH
jgi:hypothetical protein